MRLLWIQPGAIGDFIVSMPGMAWTKRRTNAVWFEIWSERINVPLAEAPNYANQALALADAGIGRYPLPKRFFERLQAFDMVLCWGETARSVIAEHHPNSHFLPSFPPAGSFHVADFKRSQLETLLGSSSEDFPPYPEIHCTEEDLQFARHLVTNDQQRPVAVIHPSASGKRKQWPLANFAELAVRLAAQRGMKIFLAEGPDDALLYKEIAGYLAVPYAKDDLVRLKVTNLRQLSAVLSLCSLYIGNDSGITHLAAASGTPTLVIFTVTDPKVWAPRGREVRVCVNPTVDEAWAALSQPFEPVLAN